MSSVTLGRWSTRKPLQSDIPHRLQSERRTRGRPYVGSFEKECERQGLTLPEEVFDSIVERIRAKRGLDLAAYQPKFIVDQVVATCRFMGQEPHFEPRFINYAIDNLRVRRNTRWSEVLSARPAPHTPYFPQAVHVGNYESLKIQTNLQGCRCSRLLSPNAHVLSPQATDSLVVGAHWKHPCTRRLPLFVLRRHPERRSRRSLSEGPLYFFVIHV